MHASKIAFNYGAFLEISSQVKLQLRKPIGLVSKINYFNKFFAYKIVAVNLGTYVVFPDFIKRAEM